MQPDHAGLQADRSSDAPEVVSASRPWAPMERYSSQSKPEYYTPQLTPPSVSSTEKKTSAETYVDRHIGHDSEARLTWTTDRGRAEGRTCGLQRRMCLCLVAAIAVILTIAVVLGAVLGTVLHSSTKSDSTMPPPDTSDGTPSNSTDGVSLDPNSGFAAMYPSESATLHLYYQDGHSRIIENQFSDGQWTIQGNEVPQNAVVAENAQSGSPLAAISWPSNGAVERQVFYINNDNRLMAVNTTDGYAWSSPYEILEADPVVPGGIALSACVDTKPDGTGLAGIRVYYASGTNDRIQEVGMDFFESETNIWHAWAYFEGSDAHNGVSCALADSVTHVYMRNASSNAIEQWSWDYYDQYVRATGGWSNAAARGPRILAPIDIAATTNGEGTDTVVYQDQDGGIVCALEADQVFQDYLRLGPAANGTRIAATYGSVGSDEGAFVVYRTEDVPPHAVYQLVDSSSGVSAVMSSGRVG